MSDFIRAKPIHVPDDWDEQRLSRFELINSSRPSGPFEVKGLREDVIRMLDEGVLEYSLQKAFQYFETAIATPEIAELLKINAKHYFDDEKPTYPEPSMSTLYVRFQKWFVVTQNAVNYMSITTQSMFYGVVCDRALIDYFTTEDLKASYDLMIQKYNKMYLKYNEDTINGGGVT